MPAVEQDRVCLATRLRERRQGSRASEPQRAIDAALVYLESARVADRPRDSKIRKRHRNAFPAGGGEFLRIGEAVGPLPASGHGNHSDAHGSSQSATSHLVDSDDDARSRVPQGGLEVEGNCHSSTLVARGSEAGNLGHELLLWRGVEVGVRIA